MKTTSFDLKKETLSVTTPVIALPDRWLPSDPGCPVPDLTQRCSFTTAPGRGCSDAADSSGLISKSAQESFNLEREPHVVFSIFELDPRGRFRCKGVWEMSGGCRELAVFAQMWV